MSITVSPIRLPPIRRHWASNAKWRTGHLDALVDGKYPDSSGEGHNAQPGGTPVFVDGVNPTLTNNGVVVDLTNGWAQAGHGIRRSIPAN